MKRPFIRLNMASSIDGKITTVQRDTIHLGSAEDRALMEELRADADAVLIGSGTLIDEDPRLLVEHPGRIAQREALKGNPQPMNMVVSSTLNFPIENSRFFTRDAVKKVVFTTPQADERQREALKDVATVITVPATATGHVDVVEMVQRMPDLGIQQLLLEGGGILNFAMLRANLIDEIYLTLCPLVIGGATAQTTFEGAGFSHEMIRRLQLRSLRVNEVGELFLRYAVQPPA
ncbi:MAG: RibD family protein [Gemmatimonadetes bacterium]|nr:MAG: RibD family protein [Gemmatimonadota bacterium]